MGIPVSKVSPKTMETYSVSWYRQQISPPGAPQLIAGYPVTVNKGSRQSSMYGELTPNFHARKKSGELMPYTGFKKYEAMCDSTGNQTYDYQNYRWYYSPLVPMGEAYAFVTEAELVAAVPAYDMNSLVQHAAAKLQSSGFDALTFLAELTKTVSMFRGVGDKLLAAARGKPIGLPWDVWLEGRYGWRTLVFDLIDLSEAVHNLGEGKKTRLKERVGTKNNWESSKQTASGSNFAYAWTTQQRDTFVVNVRASVIADIGIDDFQFNVITTSWELIRFSFVIDWFINIGNVLLAAQFLAGVDRYQAGWGYKITCSRVAWATYVPQTGVTNSVSNASAGGHASLEQRVPTNVRLNPAIRFDIDQFKITDLVALVIKTIFR